MKLIAIIISANIKVFNIVCSIYKLQNRIKIIALFYSILKRFEYLC